MELVRLVALIRLTVELCHGKVHTGRRLSENPDVCHAACNWFLNTVRNKGAVAAIAGLSIISKDTLKVSQRHAAEGPAMVRKAISNAIRVRGQMAPKDEMAALRYLMKHHSQPDPNSWSNDYNAVGARVSEAMKRNDAVMIYIHSNNGGHVICVCGNVGGVLVYDPNIGVINLPARQRGALANVISLILSWYAKEMKLDSFAFLPK
jgi:hypothetical protein